MSKKNVMIITMVALVTMLLMILPVAAESSLVGQKIGPGATIFIGEEKLDITSAMNGTNTLGYWSSGANLDTSPSYTIQVSSRKTSFSVTSAEFLGRDGNWYQVDDNNHRQALAFRVADPALTLQIQNKFDGSNVGGKTVTAGTGLGFEIDTNIILDNKRWDSGNTVIAPVVDGFTATISDPSLRTVVFTPNITVGTSPILYMWDFGDGSSSGSISASSISHQYATNGAYTVRLAAYNGANAQSDQTKSSITKLITIGTTSSDLATVGAITPNNMACPVFTSTSNGLNVTLIDIDNATDSNRVWSFGDLSPNNNNPTVIHLYNVNSTLMLTYINASIVGGCNETAPVTVTHAAYGITGQVITVGPIMPIPTAGVDTTKGFMNIIVKTASGATYDHLVNIDSTNAIPLTHLYINQNPFMWNGTWNTSATNVGQRVYQTGVYTVYAESTLNNMKENYKDGSGAYYTGKTTSTVSTVTLGSNTLKIVVSKNSVVRGNAFSVQIIGQPSYNYNLNIKSPDANSATAPVITDFQVGVTNRTNTTATISTDTSGTRTVGFTTSSITKDQKYTLRITDPHDAQKYDEASVSVVKGGVSVVASGDQNYYIGEEIKLSGTNTETDTTYFFIVGPNLDSNGATLDAPRTSVTDAIGGGHFVFTDVDSDSKFSYTWVTSDSDLDSGTYTIYALSQPVNKGHLQDVAYGTVSVIIKKPYVSGSSKGTVARGDKLTITGIAEGNPSSVAIWILGKNYAKRTTQTIDSDGTYSYEMGAGDTSYMATGQYFVVVQHPMQNGQFDIVPNGDYVKNMIPNGGTNIFKLYGSGSLQGSDAAEALIQAISDPNIDDTYTKLTIFIQEPIVSINTIGDKHIGDKFTITGKTNLAVDDEILMEVYSSSFKPTQKTQSGEFSGATGTVKVLKGDAGMNSFSFNVDSSSFKADEYLVMAQAIVEGTTGSSLFNVLDKTGTTTPAATAVPTPVPTPVKTAVPTPIPTVPPTVPPTPVPTTTSAPGFGAVFALAGLVVVGFVVVRREE